MLGALSLVADLILFILTVAVVGKKPTVVKVTGMIVLVWAVDFGFVVYAASQIQMTPIEWYQQMLDEAMSMYNMALGGQLDGYETIVATVAGVSPAIYAVQSSIYVFIGLCIRWIADRIRKKSEWSPFSKLDLSIWWVLPLLLGVSCYTVSLFLSGQIAHVAFLVSLNVFVVSVVPLFVQGAAAGKGIMNRMGLEFAWQLLIGVLGIVSGLAFVVVPLLGLFDVWANFRRLPRADSGPSSDAAE